MPDRSDVMYRYDGTFEGLLCCVFESYEKKEMPCAIVSQDESQTLLYPAKEILTDEKKARRVDSSITPKISQEAHQLVRLAFLTCEPQKELLLLKFLHMGYRYGAGVMNRLTDDTVCALQKAVKHLINESHLLKGFLRFSERSGVLTAVIEPKNYVLPLLTQHFCTRYANESFMIYDRSHDMALVYRPGQYEIIPVENLALPEADETEKEYRSLWKLFYETVAIEGRYNPKCRMTHMPKRYWKYLTEFDMRPDYRMLAARDYPEALPEKSGESL